MKKEKLREVIDNSPCRTEHFKELLQIQEMGGSELLKITRSFVYGLIIGGKGAKNEHT